MLPLYQVGTPHRWVGILRLPVVPDQDTHNTLYATDCLVRIQGRSGFAARSTRFDVNAAHLQANNTTPLIWSQGTEDGVMGVLGLIRRSTIAMAFVRRTALTSGVLCVNQRSTNTMAKG